MISNGAKVANVGQIFFLVGADHRQKINVEPIMTSQIRSIINSLFDPSQVASCIRILVDRYPEEELLSLAITKFFDSRLSIDDNQWSTELIALGVCLSRIGSCKIEAMFSSKIAEFCPNIDKVWLST